MSPLLAGVVFGGSAMAAEAMNSGAIAFQDSFIVLAPRTAHLTAEKSSVPSHFYDRVCEGDLLKFPYHPARVAGLRLKRTRLTTTIHARRGVHACGRGHGCGGFAHVELLSK